VIVGETLATGAAASGISGLDLVNLFSAAASIILAIVALALSIFFFVQSKNEAERSSKSADEISSSVSRLEKIFDTLYSDRFSMMRETVTDMRQHVWKVAPTVTPSEEAEAEAREAESQAAVLAELDKISKRVGLTDTKVNELRSELSPVLHRALEEQRESAQKEVVSRDLQRYMLSRARRRPTSADDIAQGTDLPLDLVMNEILRMGMQGQLTWDGAPGTLRSTDLFRIPDRAVKAVNVDSAKS